MKTILLCMLLFSSSSLFSQDKASSNPVQTIIDIYLNSFSGEPGYSTSMMNEDMLKRFNETGMWKNPNLARFMKQIIIYKNLHFQTSAEASQKIVNQIVATIKKGHLYKPYVVLQQNGATSYIYIRAKDNKITELAYITINQSGIGASSFVGNNIDIESIRSLVPNN